MSNKPKPPKKQTEVERLTERVSRIEERAAAQARLTKPVLIDMPGCAYTEMAVERDMHATVLVINSVRYGCFPNLFCDGIKYRRKRICSLSSHEARMLRDFLTAYLDAQ